MTNPHRSHRRRKKSNAGRLGLAGALTGAVGIAGVAAGIVMLRAGDDTGPSTAPTLSGGQGGRASDGTPATPRPDAGAPLTLNTPEGYGYELSAVDAGTDARPLRTTKTSDGAVFAYADYTITNTQRRPVPLDYPADLFLPRAQVPASAQERCMPQPGIPDSMCTLPGRTEITARVDDSRPPFTEDGDTLIPAGASYLVRVATDLPVKDSLKAADLRLFVYNPRFVSDRKGVEVTFR
ncbi:hypothetical protein [Actinomadura flavalba]|uniref:hypothetical protein n=1 Tax=Actinomadura flavalba TaxID=1120938 RepID=UPI000376C199|nr:hypothetical protein [Actinomadura flavalba]